MMHFAALAMLAATAIAAPAITLDTREVGDTANELTDGPCRPLILIFGRGSTQSGNLGDDVGPGVCNDLKDMYGSDQIACQGIGGAYTGDLIDNLLPEGTTTGAWEEAIRLFELAESKCPHSKVVAGGYSQGAAVLVASVRRLSDGAKKQLVGIVMFGNTQTAQDGGEIPDFPPAHLLNICRADDGVCYGTPTPTPGHLQYLPAVPEAVTFLQGCVAAAGGL